VGNKYVEPRGARHKVEIVDGVEQIRIPMRRNWFVTAFLLFWLTMWTTAGINVGRELYTDFSWFLLLWLGGWAAGWVFAASTLAAQFWGAETIATTGGDLLIRSGAGALARTWRYRGSDIRNLQSDTPTNDLAGMRYRPAPFWIRPRSGAVRFDYGAETIYWANGIDEPEGREIVAWLARRLPARAMEIA
jgi:hypothetical protein